MVEDNLMNKITTVYSKMTKAEKKVADIVLSNPQDVLRATISDLASMCGVGETSVFRFCRTLSLNGYQDFKLALAFSTTASGLSQNKTQHNPQSSPDCHSTAQNVLKAYKSALDNSFQVLNFKNISKTVDLMLGAKTINLFGFGGSGTTANEAKNKLMKIMSNVTYNFDSHNQLTQAALLSKNDLAIIFCNSGITKDCIEIAKICHLNEASVVFITMFPKTPAAAYCDILLLCGSNEGPMEGGSIATKTSQLFLMDILYSEIYRRMGDTALENKKKTSKVITEKMM